MRRIAISAIRALAALALVLAILGAGLAWRLTSGPVSLTFLTPYLEEALNRDRGGDLGIRLGRTVLTWAGRDRPLDIRARDVTVVDAGDNTLAELPEIAIGLDGRALLEARLRPSRIDVIGAETVVVRRGDGAIGLGFGEASVRGDDSPPLARLALDLLAPPGDDPDAGGGLARLSILDSELTLIDEVNGALWRATGVDLVVLRQGRGVGAQARLELDFGDRRAVAAATLHYDGVSGSADVSVSFEDLYLPDLARQGPGLGRLAGLELRAGGTVRFTVGGDGAVSDVGFSITGDGGFIDLPGTFAEPLAIGRASARGSWKWPAGEVALDELALDLEGTEVAVTGSGRLLGEEPEFAGKVRIRDLPAARLLALWPPDLAVATRRWVESRVHDGRIVEANFTLGGSGSGGAFAAEFAFAGATAAFMKSLPPLREVSGRGRIVGERLELSVETGKLDGIDVSEMSVAITGLAAPVQDASITFVLRGDLADLLALLDAPKLGLVRAQGIAARSLGGAVAARAHLVLPITAQGTPYEAVNFAVSANLADVSGSLPLPAADFDRGTLSLRLDRAGFEVDGAVFVRDTPVTIRWRQELGGGEASGRYLLRAQIDEAGRERLGLGTDGAIDGFVDVSVDAAVERGSLTRAVVDANFLGAAVDLAALHWRKPASRPGRARAVVMPQPDGSILFDAIELQADDLAASGQLELADDAALRRLDFGRLVIGRSDLSLSLRPRAPAGVTVAVEGRRLDFSPYLGDLVEGGEGTLPPLRFSLRVDELLIGEGEVLRGARGGGAYDGERWVDVSVSGGFGAEGAPLAFRVDRQGEARRVRIDSADAGAVAQAIGFTDNARGGRLELAARIDDATPGEPVVGHIRVRDFTLVKAPPLARILALASLQGGQELLGGGDGISFVGADLPFALRDGVLTIDEGRAFGPALGITASGRYELATDIADFSGTIVPAYTVNSLLGNIPVLGKLLIGGRGEGVFALSYALRGRADEADIVVNPLSALAPGFLRRFVTLLERPAKAGAAGRERQPVAPPSPER